MSHASEIVNTKGHWAVGVKWPVMGSKGDAYTVEMTDYGFDCNCAAYRNVNILRVQKKDSKMWIFNELVKVVIVSWIAIFAVLILANVL